MNTSLRFEMPSKLNTVAMVMVVLGIVMGAASFFMYSDTLTRVWASLLVNNFYFLALGIAGAVIMCIGYVAHAGWNTVQKRIMEAMAQYMPIGLFVMLLIGLFGMSSLYEWSDPEIVAHDHVLQKKTWFLTKEMYIGLTLFALITWTLLQFVLRKQSKKEDETPGTTYFWKSYKTSAGFMVLWGFSFCFCIFLWIMSLEPHWYSTIFAVYVFASVLVLGFTFLNVSSIYLKDKGFLPWFNTNHMHDTSKFMFAFSIFWTYLWFSQYMLIWYANVGEETVYFQTRMEQYPVLFWGNLLLNFVTPFFVLMRNDTKRKFGTLAFVSITLLFGHWWDFFLMIKPGTLETAEHAAHAHVAADTAGHAEHGVHSMGQGKWPDVCRYHRIPGRYHRRNGRYPHQRAL